MIKNNLSQWCLGPLIFLFLSEVQAAIPPVNFFYWGGLPPVIYSSVKDACDGTLIILKQQNPNVWIPGYITNINSTYGYCYYANAQTANYFIVYPVPKCADRTDPSVYNSSGNYQCPDTLNPKVAPDPPQSGTTCHPISFSTGNKVLRETDYSGLGFEPVTFRRTYNSTAAATFDSQGTAFGNQGLQWRNGLSRYISAMNGAAIAYRAGGKAYTFSPVASNWFPDADITDKLVELKDTGGNRTGWTFTVDATGEIETYDATGKLLSIAYRAGVIQTYTYDGNNRVTAIIDALGRTLNFAYDTASHISGMTNPAGGTYIYTYSADGADNLMSVTYPDGKVKSYLYGEATNVSTSPVSGISYLNSLTGIIDENNNRYATYSYDNKGRAFSEFLAGNVEQNTLVYNTDTLINPTSTIVTNPLGSSRTYNFTTILGVVKSTGQSQPAGSGCAASAAALTYDVNGNVASRTDFKGNKTTFVYDLSRNLETSRTEGLTTSNGGTTNVVTTATRTITTTYHPTWRLPLVTTEYSGGTSNLSDGSGTPTGAALRSTTNVYDTKGNLTSITEADPLHSLSRTTNVTYTYSTLVPGLVLTKVIDGPRTDVSDVTTYHYYDADSTCTPSSATPLTDPITGLSPANLGCRGQLQSMTDALGHTTTYDRYNHHGQVEQMTDANGLVTTNTYDLRQRLLTRSVTGSGIVTQTTSLTYDGVGQVTQLTLPDNSSLNYSYDAAHRLTQVQDSLGNKVTYTLDSEGNRINETTTDPQNVLTKTLTRSYDALNRLQQVIGVQ